jgi:hypothetical protein
LPTPSAPAPIDAPAVRKGTLRPDEARTLLRAFRPKPWPTDRAAAATEIDRLQVGANAYVVWLSDGLQDDGTDKLTERLRRFDGLQVVLPDTASAPILLLPPAAEGRDLKVKALRAVADGPRRVAVQASDEQGRVVARIDVDFAATPPNCATAWPGSMSKHRAAPVAPCCSTSATAAAPLRCWAKSRRPTASRCCRKSTSSRRRWTRM